MLRSFFEENNQRFVKLQQPVQMVSSTAVAIHVALKRFLLLFFSFTATDAKLVDDRLQMQYISAYVYHYILPFSADWKVNCQCESSEDRFVDCAAFYSPTLVL